MKLLKLYYFAEKFHLRTYGLFINDDDFYAMKNGSVASTAKDVLTKNFNFLNDICEEESDYINNNITIDFANYNCFINNQDSSTLSKSALTAIDFSLKHFSRFSQWDLSDITHDYIEWKKHKVKIINLRIPKVLENIDDFFLNPELNDSHFLMKYLRYDPYAEDRELNDYVYNNYLHNKKLTEYMNSPLN